MIVAVFKRFLCIFPKFAINIADSFRNCWIYLKQIIQITFLICVINA